MLDDRVLAVFARLEKEDAAERAAGVARELRSRQVTPATGRFLFTIVAPQASVSVLEIGGSRGLLDDLAGERRRASSAAASSRSSPIR